MPNSLATIESMVELARIITAALFGYVDALEVHDGRVDEGHSQS